MAGRNWAVVPACLILAAAAAAHGWKTDRWGVGADLRAAAERLDTLPTKVGDWEGVVVELTPAQKVPHVVGHTVREYTHRFTRERVTVMVLCGRPGPVSVHTPDVCYGNSGYVMGPAKSEALAAGHAAWVADFAKPGGQSEGLRIRWGWSDGGSWVAASNPRMSFARSPTLYKMYLIRPLSAKKDAPDGSPELDLLKDLFPALQQSLSPR